MLIGPYRVDILAHFNRYLPNKYHEIKQIRNYNWEF